MGFGVLGLVGAYGSGHLAGQVIGMMQRCRGILGGVAFGLILAWWMSGQMTPFFKRRSATGSPIEESPDQAKL
jgi:hypothetical protein